MRYDEMYDEYDLSDMQCLCNVSVAPLEGHTAIIIPGNMEDSRLCEACLLVSSLKTLFSHH